MQKKVQNQEGWGFKVQIAKKSGKLKRVGALKGRWKVDCKKKCKIKRVGASRCRLQKKVEN